MSNSKKTLELKQLLNERAFINFCNKDWVGGHKLNVDADFLMALGKDGLLVPLLRQKESVPDPYGQQKQVLVNYYSPHQIYTVAEFQGNKVGDEGLIISENEAIYTSNAQNYRPITMGWDGRTLMLEKGKALQSYTGDNIFKVIKNLNSFLRFLHSNRLVDRYSLDAKDRLTKERHVNGAPELTYDFTELKNVGLPLIEPYGLTIKKLKELRNVIGACAIHIDPLEYWFYYISRHPRFKRDLFKGKAALAQDLYDVCGLISEVVEAITGLPLPPLPQDTYGEHQSFLMPKEEHLNGYDIKALELAVKQFKDWSEVTSNKRYVSQNAKIRLEKTEKELKDYAKRYGEEYAYSPTGIAIPAKFEETLTLEDLDPITRADAERHIAWHEEQLGAIKNSSDFRSMFIEVREELEQGKITLEDAKAKDLEFDKSLSIGHAIIDRLDSLSREVKQIIVEETSQLDTAINRAWYDAQNPTFIADVNELQRKTVELHKKATRLTEKRKEPFKIVQVADLVFCPKCRKNIVTTHWSSGDASLSNLPICDECIKNEQKNPGKKGDTANDKRGEWRCASCDSLLFRFASANTVTNTTQNNITTVGELVYGKMLFEVRCKCGYINRRAVDWGWGV